MQDNRQFKSSVKPRSDGRPPRVFVAEPNSRYDLSSAGEFGTIVYIVPTVVNPFHTGITTNEIVSRLEELQFDPEHDYFCCAGYMITVMIAFGAIVSRFQWCPLLMYEARNNCYVDRLFNPLEKEDHDSTALPSARSAIA